MDSLYLDYSLYLQYYCLKPLPRCLEHFHEIGLNSLSLSQTFVYLEQKFRSRCNDSLPISNFLLACSAMQISYRVSYFTFKEIYFDYSMVIEKDVCCNKKSNK